MRKILIYILPLILLGYCSKPNSTVRNNQEKNEAPQTNPGQEFAVSGRVEVSGSYCGGARPTQEMEEEARRPKPFAHRELVIRSGENNDFSVPIIKRVKTDVEGKWKTMLPPGTYCLALGEKAEQPDYSTLNKDMYQVNETCNKEWLNKCEVTFEVKDAPVSGLHLGLNRRCFQANFNPCVMYIGPLPP